MFCPWDEMFPKQALREILQPIGAMHGHDGVFDRDPPVFAKLAESARDSLARGARH